MDPGNILEKTFQTHKYSKENILGHKLPTIKNVEPMKFQQENILNPQNTHQNLKNTNKKYIGPIKHPPEKKLDPQRHGSTIAQSPQDT